MPPRIQIDPERFDELLGDEFFGFFEGNLIWLYKALSHFVLNGENGNTEYMSPEDAFAWLKSTYTVKEIKEVRRAFLENMQKQAVPLVSEKGSETALSQEQS